jgi:hypothetical protein
VELDEETIAQKIRNNLPACVAGFRLLDSSLPVPVDTYFCTSYRLGCRCGYDQGAVLGYPLKAYNPEYDGPDFITPLSFKCATCAGVTQIIDTAFHGYHAEVGKIEGGVGSATMHGTGEPLAFACPDCSKAIFSVTIGFVYWDFDLFFDEPHLPSQDFFNEFLIFANCRNCGKTSAVANLGKL